MDSISVCTSFMPSTLGFFQNPSRLKLGSSWRISNFLVIRIRPGQSSGFCGVRRTRNGQSATLPEGVWIVQTTWRRESGQVSRRLHFTNEHPIPTPSAAFAKLSALTAGPKFVSPMDLRSPRLDRMLSRTRTESLISTQRSMALRSPVHK
jgi:hypothetical protein